MSTSNLFGDWMMRTRVLQRMAFGIDVAHLDPDDRARYFSEMGFAAVVEIGEMSNEIGWKSWATDRTLNRDAYIKEGVDVLHFIANMLAAAGVTDDELNQVYSKKMDLNLARQASGGYNGRTDGKCPACRRSFDDVGQADGQDVCKICAEG